MQNPANVTNKEVIQLLVQTAIETYAQGFQTRHELDYHNPNGTLNMKIHNVFIAALGPEIQYYNALCRSLDSSLGNMLGITSLAIGSDQLFTEILRKSHIPYIAVIPCANYEQTFTDRNKLESYIDLIQTASTIIKLPFDKPTETAFLKKASCASQSHNSDCPGDIILFLPRRPKCRHNCHRIEKATIDALETPSP